ncbi:hypothetical protein PSTEL_17035 [Paenibacillus stellifer]|uniref:Signal transduction histidine kinase internal region domain-containing protein n=1 Tax=Paenibacillus stellifer TaxID=169760 RepID=A0A089LWM6_9BACL|nr:hypothetical protein PSTEL_17035 [Paenibacillus stellifer]
MLLYVLAGSLLPMLVVGILSGKIDNGISASLRQEALNLENAIDNLDFASKQFELDGQILEDVRFFAGEALEAGYPVLSVRLIRKLSEWPRMSPPRCRIRRLPNLFSFSAINPHFLHNTLNTVQWLVRLNGQKEIDRLVTLLVSCTERACRSWRAKPFSILFSATHPFSRSTTLSLSGRRKAAI